MERQIIINGFIKNIIAALTPHQNGFQLARMLKKSDSIFDAILMCLLFFSAVAGCVIGALLLMKKSVKPVFDWVSLLVCIGSGLFVYFNSLRNNAIDLQEGAYVIFAGWIAALAAQIVSKIKKET